MLGQGSQEGLCQAKKPLTLRYDAPHPPVQPTVPEGEGEGASRGADEPGKKALCLLCAFTAACEEKPLSVQFVVTSPLSSTNESVTSMISKYMWQEM